MRLNAGKEIDKNAVIRVGVINQLIMQVHN